MQLTSKKTFATTFRPGKTIDLDNGDFEAVQESLFLHGFSRMAIGHWTTSYLETSPEVLRANLDERAS